MISLPRGTYGTCDHEATVGIDRDETANAPNHSAPANCLACGLASVNIYSYGPDTEPPCHECGEPVDWGMVARPPEGTRLAAAGPMAERVLTEQNFGTLTKLEAFAESRGHSMLELAIGWPASQPHVASVISGATKPEQVEQNVGAAEWKLTAEDLAEVDTITRRDESR